MDNIKVKEENLNAEGINLDCLNAIIALAFSVEAFINFIGDGYIEGWNERDKYHKKLKAICDKADLKFDESVEPLSTLKKLKFLRDNIAHGKPIREEVEFEIGTADELNKKMEQSWDKNCNPVFVKGAYNFVLKFENDILTAMGIDSGLTSTSAISL
ncbi:hypothetical protein Q4503_15395 [Colwellia sp. 6_MG-2023]|uniref:hypothetical protein n=1 Tax=Colwellia sp. 6_MG-2023 TaxID=3062676 RepID=UPI0026E18337|nr:hypothetical protein [Colwellia sp. 6_MG-2023]MDO6489084.1 hypothetical protein [Colwellia sp. 6_MG-2023]